MRTLSIFLLLIAGLVGLAPSRLRAEAPGSPEAMVRTYFDAVHRQDIAASVELLHPEALAGFREMMAPLAALARREAAADQFLALLPGVASIDEADRLNPAEFYAAFQRGVNDSSPMLVEILGNASAEILGRVDEGPDMTHVVYRMKSTAGGAQMTKTTVVTLKRTPSGWRVLLNGTIDDFSRLVDGNAPASPP